LTGPLSDPAPLRLARRSALVGAFVASGAAALLFQVLWFRQLALSLGNTVWAGSLVLASFMGGLALGNLLAARWRGGVQSSLRAYAWLEAVVALTGLGLVVILPRLPQALAPLLGGLDSSFLKNGTRLGVSSVLMLVPTTAMGATLPVLIAALARRRDSFGVSLGRLYGWNTLGAAAGALLGEAWLVPALGLTRSGVVAAGLDLVAASVAWSLARRGVADAEEQAPLPEPALGPLLGPRILGLAGLAGLVGGCGLALEVIWFRFLTMYVAGTSLAFAVMLAVVLSGIALGGLVAAEWMTRAPGAHRWMAALGAGAALATTLSYATFPELRGLAGIEYTGAPLEIFSLALALMAPTCVLSGCLFPMIGRSLRDGLPTAGWAAGLLTLSNTLGATIGALLGGFVLLPRLGLERSIFAVSVVYALAALGLAALAGLPPARRALLIPGGALCALVLALFPFGLMERVYVRGLANRHPDLRLVQYREGLTETSMLLSGELLGQPSHHLLVTNGHPMSSTKFTAQRYMRLYVYWALAVHPEVRRAALISYGVGNTAAALVESPGIESIDVVDISRDIVDLGRSIFPGRTPLADPRVTLHIEDGRFFLLTTRKRFDLITSEPPPPRLAGVANLYTREYFALVKQALAEGGLVTYWLPMHDLGRASAAPIVRGFCEVFRDCSLWTGAGLDWMLVGSHGSRPRASEEAFGRQWRQEPTASALRSIGLDSPERLGALFQADAQELLQFMGSAPPFSDDFPRIVERGPTNGDVAAYRDWMAPEACRSRFERSALIREIWPSGLRERSLPYFGEQAMYAEHQFAPDAGKPGVDFARLARALLETDAVALPLVLVGSEPEELAIAERAAASGRRDPLVDYYLGLGALSRREFGRAADLFDGVAAAEPGFQELVFLRALSRCLAGDGPRASVHLAAAQQRAADEEARQFWATLAEDCGAAAAAPAVARPVSLSPRADGGAR
jgi:predicted membrane-bound spermidine synthase